MTLNRVLQVEEGRAENRSIIPSIRTNLGRSLSPGWVQLMLRLLTDPLPTQVSTRKPSSAWSPFKEVPIDGWKPLQGDRGGGPSHDLGGDGDRSRFLCWLPALIDQVQVAVHPGHLVGCEGVGAVIVWNRSRNHISCMGLTVGGLQAGEGELLHGTGWDLTALRS